MKTEYEPTETAGPFVAGARVPPDGRLFLTERQAAHELRLGNIRPVSKAKAAAKNKAEAEGEVVADKPKAKG